MVGGHNGGVPARTHARHRCPAGEAAVWGGESGRLNCWVCRPEVTQLKREAQSTQPPARLWGQPPRRAPPGRGSPSMPLLPLRASVLAARATHLSASSLSRPAARCRRSSGSAAQVGPRPRGILRSGAAGLHRHGFSGTRSRRCSLEGAQAAHCQVIFTSGRSAASSALQASHLGGLPMACTSARRGAVAKIVASAAAAAVVQQVGMQHAQHCMAGSELKQFDSSV